MSLIRQLAGPVMVAASVWCAAGLVTVTSADSSAARLAVPAPWWVFAAALIAAAVIGAWRHHPVLALPAVLSTLPWWPVPLPPIALMWTGPLAWLPVGLAALAAAFSYRDSNGVPEAAPIRITPASAGGRAIAAGVLTLVAGVAAAWSVDPRVPGGDEPHYLVITQSLLADGDLRIANNHERRDYAAYYPGEIRPDYIQKGKDGEIYSIHAPGVSVIVAPAFWAFGYRGAQAMMLLFAALAGGLIWTSAWRMTGDPGAAWFAWAGVALSTTFLLQSGMVFPDAPGACAVAAAVWLLTRLADPTASVRMPAIVAVSAGLAALPWLHTRFAVLAAGFGLAVTWQMARRGGLASRERRRAILGFVAIPVVSALAWFAFFYAIYGSPDPTAPYGPPGTDRSASYIPGGMAALLFDAQFGLVTYAPVLMVCAAGLWRAQRGGLRGVMWAAVATATAYLAATGVYWMWWGGNPATPARFATAILPILSLPLAAAWGRADRHARTAQVALLGISIVLATLVIGLDRGAMAWNHYQSRPAWLDWLGPVVNLTRGWPSFFWRLVPGEPASEVTFAWHLAAWCLVAGLAWAVSLAWARREGTSAARSAAIVLTAIALALMLAVQAGWWLSGTRGFDPAPSQIAVLTTLAGSRSALWLTGSPGRRLSDPDGVFTIAGRQESQFAPRPPWLTLQGLPPGRYELRVSTDRPVGGALAVRLGRSPAPLHTFGVAPVSRQSFPVALPAGAAALTVNPDDALRQAGGSATLVPLSFEGRDPSARAQSYRTYGATGVFFLDSGAFAEESGFWVRGESSAQVVLIPGTRGPSVEILVRNGAAANAVVLETPIARQTIELGPGEERLVSLPMVAGADHLSLRVTSPAGFRPPSDARFLGVWLEPR